MCALIRACCFLLTIGVPSTGRGFLTLGPRVRTGTRRVRTGTRLLLPFDYSEPQEIPKYSQESPKRLPRGTQVVPRGPTRPPRDTQVAPRGPRKPPSHPKGSQDIPQDAPRGPHVAPRDPTRLPRGTQVALRGLQDTERALRNAKTSTEGVLPATRPT